MRAPVLLSALVGLAALASAATDERVALPTVDLSPLGGRETWPIALGQVRRHEIHLQAGEFLRVTVVQEGIDVTVRTVSAMGMPHEVDVSEGPRGREPASILADAPGTYAIEVEVPSSVRGPAAYSLSVEPVRAATARDREWMRAEWALGEGGRRMGPRSGDTRRGMPSGQDTYHSLAWFAVAQGLIERSGDTCWRAEVGTHVILLRTWLPHSPRSSDEFARLLDDWQACGDQRKFNEAILYAGRWFQWTLRYQDAASVFDLGLRLARERGDDVYLELQFLVALGTVRGLLGDTVEATALQEEALPILRRLHLRQGEAVVLEGLATSAYRRGSLQEAADLALQAVAIRLEIGDRARAGTELMTVAEIHDAMGEPEVALRYYDQAASLYSEYAEGGDGLRIIAEAASADVLRQLGQRDAAVGRLRKLIALAERLPALQSIGLREMAARIKLARIDIDEEAWDDALLHTDKAMAAVERAGDRYTRAMLLELRGRTRLARDDRRAARTDLDESLAIRRALGDRIGEASSLYEQSRLALTENDAMRAAALLEDARRIVRSQRTLITNPSLRATWATTVRRIDEAYVALAMSSDRTAAAFEASDAAHARSLLEMLGERRAALPEGGHSALAERERSLRERLTNLLDRQMRPGARSDPAAEAEIRDLAFEHERVRAELRRTDPRYAAFADPEPIRMEAVQRGLLDADTTLVEYFLGAERSHAWVVTKDSLRGFELPPRARVDAAVGDVRRGFEQRPASSGASDRALRAVAALVIDPLADALVGRRLVVVPDGSLHHVPFAALTDPRGRPLLGRFEVQIAPSASVIALQRQERPDRPAATRAVAVLADPVFDARDERLGGARQGGRAPTDAVLTRATRGFGFSDGRLPRLPFTRREARSIQAVAPADASRIALDFGASLAMVRDPDLASYRYLHFATHGLINDARPELSGIVLTLVDAQGRPQRGLLTAPEVLDLELGADLVVLSSCRSALGREVHGEGLLGLTRAFMYAGVPRVMASLWPVDDLATSELMKRFYRGMLGPDRLTPAAALRAAQQDLRRQPQWRHPYYWAGFQLLGDWN